MAFNPHRSGKSIVGWQNLARSAEESEAPSQWNSMVGLFAPCLGPQHQTAGMRDLSHHGGGSVLCHAVPDTPNSAAWVKDAVYGYGYDFNVGGRLQCGPDNTANKLGNALNTLPITIFGVMQIGDASLREWIWSSDQWTGTQTVGTQLYNSNGGNMVFTTGYTGSPGPSKRRTTVSDVVLGDGDYAVVVARHVTPGTASEIWVNGDNGQTQSGTAPDFATSSGHAPSNAVLGEEASGGNGDPWTGKLFLFGVSRCYWTEPTINAFMADPLAMIRRRANLGRSFKSIAATPESRGPYSVEAIQFFSPGAAAVQMHTPGADQFIHDQTKPVQVHSPGAEHVQIK